MADYNKIIHGDCFEVMRTLKPKSIDLVLADPPYVYKDYSPGNKGFDEKIENIEFIKSISGGFNVDQFFDLAKTVLKKMNVFCCCSQHQVPDVMRYGLDNKFQTNLLVWQKGGRPFGTTYLHDTEFIVHIRETGAPFNGAYKSRVFNHYSRRTTGHPTEKPIQLFQRLVLYGSNAKDTVLDPFSGSGTTGVACMKNNRNFICIEKEREYWEKSVERITKEAKRHVANMELFERAG